MTCTMIRQIILTTLFVGSAFGQSPIKLGLVTTKVRSALAEDRSTIFSAVFNGVNNNGGVPINDLTLNMEYIDIFSMKTDLFTYVNDNSLILDSISEVRCGQIPTSNCVVAPYVLADPVDGRTSFKITTTTDLFPLLGEFPGNDIFDQQLLSRVNATLQDPLFNFTTTEVDSVSEDGFLEFSYTVKKPYSTEPSTVDDLQRVVNVKNAISAALVGITGTVIDPPTTDYCSVRDCNGGSCNANTGICTCVGDVWGISCEVACVCDNGGICGKTHCKCQYPYKGRTCATEATECSDGSCV